MPLPTALAKIYSSLARLFVITDQLPWVHSTLGKHTDVYLYVQA